MYKINSEWAWWTFQSRDKKGNKKSHQALGQVGTGLTGHFCGWAIIVAVSIYNSPKGDPKVFLQTLINLSCYLSKWRDNTILVGRDLNYNFDITNNSSQSFLMIFLNLLRKYNIYCLNRSPIRQKNCLDNVFTNNRKILTSCLTFDFTYSDHRGILIELKNMSDNYNNIPPLVGNA